MRIGYLGAGTWGFTLAGLLASKGHEVFLWTASEEFAKLLHKKKEHPKLHHYKVQE
jgi:glycerol-3-phosphate dehydrogenase (NAD(P)+)